MVTIWIILVWFGRKNYEQVSEERGS